MIFVVADANILHVVDSEAELQGAFEGIDVEEGTYRFFDEYGMPLTAKFTEPNKKGKLFGIFWSVVSGTYRLIPAKPGLPSLSDMLNSVVGLERNSYFADLQEVRELLTSRSKLTQ